MSAALLRRPVTAFAAMRGASRRTLLDRPNTILQQQKDFQGGTTPYLRGEADPTYLRKSGDSTVAAIGLGAVAFGWIMAVTNHVRMWYGNK